MSARLLIYRQRKLLQSKTLHVCRQYTSTNTNKTSRMNAVWFDSFGPAKESLTFGMQPKPKPLPGEVLVKLKTSGVNPSDVKKRAGSFPNLLENGPVIPHSDGAGIIESVGSSIDNARIGERVFVYQAQYSRRHGTAAEYVCVDSNRAPVLPTNTSFDVGACIGIPIMTAHRCIHADGPIVGQTVVITGGAGKVGYYAIQLAKLAGAKVIATASNDTDKKLCEHMGADVVIDHRESNWGDELLARNNGAKVSRVVDVDFGSNLPEILKFVDMNGVIATYSSMTVSTPSIPFFEMMYLSLTIRMVIVYAMPEESKREAIADICRLLSENKLSHRITSVMPFAEMVRAHELVEQGSGAGCVVIRVDE